MTSNGNEDVNHSQNQPNKVQNGLSQMKCGGSMLQGAGRKPNRSNHNMGLKRNRSVDPAAGMCLTKFPCMHQTVQFGRRYFYLSSFSCRYSWHSAKKIEIKQWHCIGCTTAKKYRGYAQRITPRSCLSFRSTNWPSSCTYLYNDC